MDPFIFGTIALGLYLFFRRRKTAAGSIPDGTPDHDDDGTPPGPFDPFNPPDGGSGGSDDEGTPAPVPVPSDTTPADIGPYTLAITQDCQQVFEGEQWFDSVFLPACERLVEAQGATWHHPWLLMHALLLREAAGGALSPACILSWTYFRGVTRDYPGGPWDSDTEAGYYAFLTYAAWYAENYPALDAFLVSLDDRLWNSTLAPHFNQYDEPIVFLEPMVSFDIA